MSTEHKSRQLYPLPEAQERLGGVSRVMLYRLANEGRLKMLKIGRRTFVSATEIDRFVASLAKAA
jgi:hypothetical protein